MKNDFIPILENILVKKFMIFSSRLLNETNTNTIIDNVNFIVCQIQLKGRALKLCHISVEMMV
jgi:hypothetical protein